MRDQVLIIMTRAPVPGETKTRLMPHFTAEQCVDFHVACLRDLSQVQKQLQIPTTIFYSGQLTERLTSLFLLENQFLPQEGKDLGERMAHAFKTSLQDNQSIVMIGADLPHLPVRILMRAFEALDHHDVVLGPAWDGGYYLIGLKRFESGLFSEITWSSSEVLKQTLEKVSSMGLTFTLLEMMRDLDTMEDLNDFMTNPENQNLHAWRCIQKIEKS